MEFLVKSGHPEKQRHSCVIVGVFDYRKLSDAAEKFDEITEGAISAITRRGDMDGRLGQTLVLYNLPNVFCDRLLLVGCGRERDFNDAAYRHAIEVSTKRLMETGSRDASNFLTSMNVRGRDDEWKIRTALQAAGEAAYRFDDCRSVEPDFGATARVKKMVFTIPSRTILDEAESAIEEGQAIISGVNLAKDLGNLPGNYATPTKLAQVAEEIAASNKKMKAEILDLPEIEKLKMGAFLAVAQGSREAPKLITLQYNGGKKKDAPIALVGKGVTFDAGGISIKPAARMDEMKFDMCGAAAVLGTMKALSMMKLPINVVAVIPACENLPDGLAVKPGDVVTSMAGKTIEILNTDAEGRLLLCDALHYVQRFDPHTVIDIATLTGACVVALGSHASGMYSNDRSLTKELNRAAQETGDRVWEMPLWDDYARQLRSTVADIANIGGPEAGSVTAACFLKKFIGEHRWAHLDIAGTAWLKGARKGATGRPVSLLVDYLADQANES